MALLAPIRDRKARRSWQDDPDVARMLRVQRGETGAFAELVERYWLQIFGRFCRRLGDRQEAEDLTQDVFLRVYRHRLRYRPRAKFATWLFLIADNVGRNALRARRRRARAHLACFHDGSEKGTPAANSFPDRGEPPSCRLERAELAQRVRSAVAGLAGRQRTALELYQFRHWSYSEIAAAMHMSPKAAKSLLYRARHELRTSLAPAAEACL
jgi:RNA polymerase sigma-70 factor (ECF subfamily)